MTLNYFHTTRVIDYIRME